MANSPSSSPAPGTGDGEAGVVGAIAVAILVCPFAALAAGAAAFIGMSVAAAGWGNEYLGHGAVAGAGSGVSLVIAWAVIFVGRARASKEDLQAHAKKLAAYSQDMKSRGVGEDGPVFRLLWMLGLKVPPPLFLGTCGSFLYPLGIFAPMILSAGAVIWWQRPSSSRWIMWVTASIFLLAAVGLGVYNVTITRSLAMKLQLPSWDQYLPAAPITEVADSSDPMKR
jgi:hypothetical protein